MLINRFLLRSDAVSRWTRDPRGAIKDPGEACDMTGFRMFGARSGNHCPGCWSCALQYVKRSGPRLTGLASSPCESHAPDESRVEEEQRRSEERRRVHGAGHLVGSDQVCATSFQGSPLADHPER